MQELALAYGHDLQMRLQKRKIPRPQRGQETIASILVLIWSHVGPNSPSARDSTHVCRDHQPILEVRNFLAAAFTRQGVPSWRERAHRLSGPHAANLGLSEFRLQPLCRSRCGFKARGGFAKLAIKIDDGGTS